MHLSRSLFTLLVLAFSVSLSLGGPLARAQTPTLETDRQNYLPGETVVLIGSGFEPGETVDVSIAIDDDENNIHIGDYDWMVELADDSGDFITFWTVPAEAFGMTLRATALGLTSSRVATATFYDDVGTHFINYRIVGMEALVPPTNFPIMGLYPHSGAPISIPVSTDGTISASIATTPQAGPVQFLENASYTVSGVGTWTFSHSTPSNFFMTGLSGETTTVTMFYNANLCVFNNPPTLTASDISIPVCAGDGVFTVTLTPDDFNPSYNDPDGDPQAGVVEFWDGSNASTSQTITFGPGVSMVTLTLRATDDPSGRSKGPAHCANLVPHTAYRTVVVTASVFPQSAPVVTGNNLSLGSMCGSNVTVPVSLADFGASAVDPDGDPFYLSLDKVNVTLTLPEGVSDGVVSECVTISATDDPSARDNGTCDTLQPLTGSKVVTVSAHLYRNRAPIITASNANLGDIVGILSGNSFRRTVNVSPATFGASAYDPDGDPVTLVANVSQVTLVGPGVATAVVQLIATDNPTARTDGVCTTPATTTMPVEVSARIVYNFDGPLFPLNTFLSCMVRRGAVVPVRFRLYDANGTEIRTVLVNPAGGPTAHTLSVAFNQANAPDGAVDIEEFGFCDDGITDFHYLLFAWDYLLQTNSTYQINTTYVIRIYTNDGVMHPAMISIKR